MENHHGTTSPRPTISSPRMMSPRSVRRAQRSVRRQEQEAHDVESAMETRAADNLAPSGSPGPAALSMDPASAYLAPAGEETIRDIEAQQEKEREERGYSTRFVGGFTFERMKKAVSGASIQWGSGSRRTHGVDHDPPYRLSGIESQSPDSHRRSSSSSDTMRHPATTEEGTTAIDHTNQPYIQPQDIQPEPETMVGSPEFLQAEDYRKMERPSPPPEEISFTSYLSRLKKIIDKINNMPWVAEERVTVDYYPGQSKRRVRTKAPQGTAQKHRSAISTSWYGNSYSHYKPAGTLNMQEVDLTAGDSPEVLRNATNLSLQKEENNESYYANPSGQVWPAITSVLNPGPIPSHHPDPSQTPSPPPAHFEPRYQATPRGGVAEPENGGWYTNNSGQVWPVVAPVVYPSPPPQSHSHYEEYDEPSPVIPPTAHIPNGALAAGPSH